MTVNGVEPLGRLFMVKKYRVDFEYNVPEFSSIELNAETDALAAVDAEKELMEQFPEILDLEVIKVTEI